MSYIAFMSSLYQTNKHQIACEPTWRAVVSTKWFVSNSGFQLTAFLLFKSCCWQLVAKQVQGKCLVIVTSTWLRNHVLVRTSANSAFGRISFVGSQTKKPFCPWRNIVYLILIVTWRKRTGYFTVRLTVIVDPPPIPLPTHLTVRFSWVFVVVC